jgi:hypothetical protein
LCVGPVALLGLATRFERRFLVSGGDDGSLAFWHLARRPAHAFGSFPTHKGRSGKRRGAGGGAEDQDEDQDEDDVVLRPPPALALAQLATGENARSSRSSGFNGALGSMMGALGVSGSSGGSSGSGGSGGLGVGGGSGCNSGGGGGGLKAPRGQAGSNGIDDGAGGHYLEFEKMRAFHGHGGPVRYYFRLEEAPGGREERARECLRVKRLARSVLLCGTCGAR